MYKFLSTFIVEQRTKILLLLFAAFALSAVLSTRVQFNFTPQQLFHSTSAMHDVREAFADRFGREDNLVAIIISGNNVLEPKTLEVLRDLTLDLRQANFTKQAESIATISIPRPGEFAGSMATEPFLQETFPPLSDAASQDAPLRGASLTEAQAQSLAEIAMAEPLIRSQMISEDLSTSVVLVWIHDHVQEVEELQEVVESIENTIARYSLPDGFSYSLTGVPALRVEIVDNLRREQMTFIPLTGLAYLLVLLILFRRASGVLLPLGTVTLALFGTLAILVLTGSPINIVNNVLPSLIFIIGISDSIHMLTRQAEEIELGHSHFQAVSTMIRHTGVACLLTTGTTAVGFLSLLSANTNILKQFGWQAAVGVMFAYLATLLFLPAALTFMRPVKRITRKETGPNATPVLERILMASGEKILQFPWTISTIGVVLAIVFAVLGSRVNIDTTLLEVFSEKHPSYQSTKLMQDKLGGFLPVEISLESPDRDRFKDPDIYQRMHAFQRHVESLPGVLSTESLVDYHQATRAALLGESAEREKMPDSRDQIEQLHLLIAGAPDSPSGVNRYVSPDFRYARILIRVADTGAKHQLELGNKYNEKLAELFPPDLNVLYHITGDAYTASAALNSFIRDLFYSLWIAILIIIAMMAFVFKSWKIGLISILPNCLPLLMTFAYMGVMGIDLNTTTIIIFAISLGIAVDDSIHVFARFKEECDRTDDLREAILNSYYGAGRAILITSVMLLIGLCVLLLSDFIPTQQFGTLMAITIAGAVLADLLVLPALLYLVFKNQGNPLRSRTS